MKLQKIKNNLQPVTQVKRKTAAKRGYNARWQRERAEWISEHTWCEYKGEGCTLLTTVINHRIPHRGDEKLFWDKNNWQGVCKHCHDTHIQRDEFRDRYFR